MLNLGIIGLGYWGPNFVRIFSDLPNCTVKAVSDLSLDRMKSIAKKYPSIAMHNDYKAILEDKTIDAVIVATNLATHYKIVSDALSCGKHVLVEKPMTNTVKNAAALVKLAEKKKKLLMVGHTFLYNTGVLKLKEYIDKKEIGKLLYLHSVRTNLGPIRKDANAMWDLASHDISILLYLLGQMPLKVSAKGGIYLKNDIEDVVFLTLYFKGNILGNIHVSWLEPCKVRRITLIGDKKMVVFDDVNALEPIKVYDKGVIKEKRYDTFGEFQLVLRDGDVLVPKLAMSEPLKNECLQFVKAVETGKNNINDGAFGLKVVQVLCAAQKSLKNNGVPQKI